MRTVKRLNDLTGYFQNPVIRWALTLTWTAITASLMLSPGTKGGTVSQVSHAFGGTEITDAIGHIIINTILAFLWCWTISLYAPPAKTTRLILIGGTVWGCVGEFSQLFVPDRGTSLLDLGANVLGVVVGVMVYGLFVRVEGGTWWQN